MSDALSEMLGQLLAIILGTFASEDLTCLSVGLLIDSGKLSWPLGLAASALGIFVSDLALWFMGRAVRCGSLSSRWLGRWLPGQRLEPLASSFRARGGVLLLAARFMPGTRLPLYVAAGVLGQPLGQFAFWTALAAVLWTPLVILGVVLLGDQIVGPFTSIVGQGWPALLLAALAMLLTLRMFVSASTAIGRARLWARVSRVWRWEFWPTWLFYLPLLPWLLWLSVRYRGLMTWTVANPGIPSGGVVGESKHAILEQLPERWMVPSLLVRPGATGGRLAEIRQTMNRRAWAWPLILKPDASHRGAGLKLAHDFVDVEKYLQAQPAAIVVQTYHPGPFEAGIFYHRLPGEKSGRIFSITDKHFPVITGDGRSTLEELIWRHPRYRMQARTFLARHDDEKQRVLDNGERLRLAVAGNHCQGTMFRDGAHLITPALERIVDVIARQFDGFFIGRFDVRYTDVERFKAGQDLAIVELNGVTSESTNIYDPSWSLLSAYRTLYRQWELLYKIGAANRQRGHRVTGAWRLLCETMAFYRGFHAEPLAD
jgi:membrane protein DedA with SNARE-associated domain